MIKTVIAPNDWLNNISVFLGGSITNAKDWQSELINYISRSDLGKFNDNNIIFYNPRRRDWNESWGTSEIQTQIEWEYNMLSKCDIIVMWFSNETLAPISLYELGKWINSTNKRAIVGVDSEYKRKDDVIIQTELARPDIEVHEIFDDFCSELYNSLKLFNEDIPF